MNRPQLIQSLRFRLDEPVASVWSDLELTHYLDQAIRFVTRKQADVDESYSNYEYNVASNEMRQILGGGWVFDTPYWLYRITRIRETETSTAGRNLAIPARTLQNRTGRFWTFDRTNRIRLVDQAAANLTIECTKDPAPMLSGTIDSDQFAAPSGNTFFIRHSTATPTGVEIPKELNAYAGSMFEVTGVDLNNHQVSGQRRRVKSSRLVLSNDNVPYTEIVVDTNYDVPMLAGDTFEMMPEVLPVHHEIVVLLAAEKALVKKSNLQQLEVLRSHVAEELVKFTDSITPRQTQDIPFVGMDREDMRFFDPDVDHTRIL